MTSSPTVQVKPPSQWPVIEVSTDVPPASRITSTTIYESPSTDAHQLVVTDELSKIEQIVEYLKALYR